MLSVVGREDAEQESSGCGCESRSQGKCTRNRCRSLEATETRPRDADLTFITRHIRASEIEGVTIFMH